MKLILLSLFLFTMNVQPFPSLPLVPDHTYFHVKNTDSEQPGTPKNKDKTPWFGIAINGPKLVTFDENMDMHLDYYAIITGLCTLPCEYSSATQRLSLVIERLDTHQEFTNSVSALSQPNGLSINRSYEEPSKAPYITQSLLDKAPDDCRNSDFPNPNFSLLNFPNGSYNCKVYMTLDGLRSNEIMMTIVKKL